MSDRILAFQTPSIVSYLIEFSKISLEKLNIQQAFNAAAADYDKLRRTLIPCFDDFYKTAVEVIPANRTTPLKVLDLGAGTGLYSGMVQAVFPNAEITLLDLAVEMLEKAKSRFSQMGKSPRIVIGDYMKAD